MPGVSLVVGDVGGVDNGGIRLASSLQIKTHEAGQHKDHMQS